MVVLAGSKGSILLRYEKEGRGLQGLGRGYSPIFEMFFDEGFADFSLCRVEWIVFCSSWGEGVFKLDSVVEISRRW